MLFSSPIFLFAFLPVTLAGYYLLDRKFKNIFLLIMSLIFYAWGEPKFIFIMLISIMANWLFGLWINLGTTSVRLTDILPLWCCGTCRSSLFTSI